MTKKDYEAIAKLIEELTEVDGLIKARFLVSGLARYFKADNPRFNALRFFDACCQPLSDDEIACINS